MSHFVWRERRERKKHRVGNAKTSLPRSELACSSSWPQERARATINLTLFSRFSPSPFSVCPHSPTLHQPPPQVVARDYPRPDIDNSGPFIEAAQLSSSLAASARPAKPLKVVIAGAGKLLGISPLWFFVFFS